MGVRYIKIKQIRQSKNIGLNELARISDLSPAYLSSLERKIKVNPSVKTIKKIAVALGCSLDELLSEDSK